MHGSRLTKENSRFYILKLYKTVLVNSMNTTVKHEGHFQRQQKLIIQHTDALSLFSYTPWQAGTLVSIVLIAALLSITTLVSSH